MGHVGMTPQSINAYGGFRVQGRGVSGQAVVDAAKRVEDAGAFSIVLELIPAELAARITEELEIPTIGIGAGPHCSGQVQVIYETNAATGCIIHFTNFAIRPLGPAAQPSLFASPFAHLDPDRIDI